MTNSKRFIINVVSTAIRVCGIAMLPASFVGLYYNETKSSLILFTISVITITIGRLVARFFANPAEPPVTRARYAAILITWLVLIFIGMLPFYGAGDNYSLIDSVVESCAGFCTTGLSVIPFSSMPLCLQLWRCLCSWIGGLLCVMLTMSLTPSLLVTGRKLFSAEIPSLSMLKESATYRGVYFKLMTVYFSVTLAGFILLMVFGMGKFNALITALCSISTSGLPMFSVDSSVGFNWGIKTVITILNLLGSLNVALIYIAALRGFKRACQNNELNFFLKILLISTAVISISQIWARINAIGPGSLGDSPAQKAESIMKMIADSIMVSVSFSSTSGFITSDHLHWTPLTTTVLLLISMIGTCAVSTGGGIKVSRLVAVSKSIRLGIYQHVHPNAVKPVKINGKPLDSAVVIRYSMYMVLFLIFILFGALLLSLDTLSIEQCIDISTSMMTTNGTVMSNLSNGTQLFQDLMPFSKVVIVILMIAGRIEIYPVLMILFKSFWITKSND
mgnify:CR=1 FL=1